VSGSLTTNLNFHRWLMDNPRWAAGEYDTRFITDEYRPGAAAAGADAEQIAGLLAAAFVASLSNHRPAAAAPAGAHRQSAWKTVGRIDSLRR
jgi:acetyl/propionyl-CoA carboxylase alpha subunit